MEKIRKRSNNASVGNFAYAVALVRPDRNPEPERQGRQFDVVRVAFGKPSFADTPTLQPQSPAESQR